MANSPKGSGNPLLPIAIIGVVVVAVIVGVFALGGEEAPPDQPTVIADDSVEGEPAGAGTLPEGQPAGGASETERGADELEEGITDQVDDVEPAAEGVDSVPAADQVDSSGPDVEGETDADEEASGTADDDSAEADPTPQPVGTTSIEARQAGGADGQQSSDDAATLRQPEGESSTTDPLIDDETVGNEAEDVDTPAAQETTDAAALPTGRDAQTNLDPSDCQEIVRDTDSGGAAFIATPSGPDANTRGECLESQQ